MIPISFVIIWRALFGGISLVALGVICGSLSAQSSALPTTQVFDDLQVENTEHELKALAAVGGTGVCLLALLLFVRRLGCRMHSDTFLNRLAGLPPPPDLVSSRAKGGAANPSVRTEAVDALAVDAVEPAGA